MSILEINNGGARKYDLVALGEIMLRLDPGEGRVRTAREFKVGAGSTTWREGFGAVSG
jgi:2-dehydro-3-deoxygluconokinase